jgi:hypothetical protein
MYNHPEKGEEAIAHPIGDVRGFETQDTKQRDTGFQD